MLAHEWMRQGVIDVMTYLPPFLRTEPLFTATAASCSEEHNRMRLALQDLANNCFVATATWALPLFESFLGLSAGTASVDVRRQQILLAIQGAETSTLERMNRIVNAFSTGTIEEHPEQYYFIVTALFMDQGHFDALMATIETFKPAHLGVKYRIGGTVTQSLHFGAGNRVVHHVSVYPQSVERAVVDTPIYVAVTATFMEEIELEER